ncbi:hypothetical protein C7S14_2130 [Burkholderia cepacia]|nr:hypothetical protein C7S14_2130 [Burkholderia cepacia]
MPAASIVREYPDSRPPRRVRFPGNYFVSVHIHRKPISKISPMCTVFGFGGIY